MNYVGVDLHKETSWFYVLDAKGKKLDSKNLTNNLENLKKYFEHIPKPFTLTLFFSLCQKNRRCLLDRLFGGTLFSQGHYR